MKIRTGSILLLALGFLMGAGNGLALGAKGDGMGHQGKRMMKKEEPMQRQDGKMMKEKKQEKAMQDQSQKDKRTMTKERDRSMQPGGEKTGNMKDTMQ